jgi:hypothetical protein
MDIEDIPPVLANRVGLTARRLAKLLNERSVAGMDRDPQLTCDEVIAELKISCDEAAEAATELDEVGIVILDKSLNMGKAGFYRIAAKSSFFIATDGILQGWNTIEDARRLVGTIIDNGQDDMLTEELCKLLSWEPRRINPVLSYLNENGLAVCFAGGGGDRFEFYGVRVNPRTRLFIRNAS